MTELGNQIRKLRKARGLTQEQFASALSISPQAVSKWESCNGFPDMAMIPILANFFDVSLDELFDFDITKKPKKIEDILEEARHFFWNDFDNAEKIYSDGIKEFPGSDILRSNLLNLYEGHIRCNNRIDLYPKAEALAERLVIELTDIYALCDAKSSLASIYGMQGKYAEAKRIIETLPVIDEYKAPNRFESAAYHLKGQDRLDGALMWKQSAEQELFYASDHVGMGYFEVGDYKKALKAFTQASNIIEGSFIEDKEGVDAYPAYGDNINHMIVVIGIAGAQLKLGHTAEFEKALAKAKTLLEMNLENEEDEYIREVTEIFNHQCRNYGLDEYVLSGKK